MFKKTFVLMLFFAFLAPVLRAGTLYYYTYSAFETGQDPSGFLNGYAHLYAIRDATDCWLYRVSQSNAGVDISTGAVYSSLGMMDGQPFDPAIVDGLGPG